MKKKSIKKWILSLCSAMMLSLVVGFSLPKTEAKALSADEYNIYDYSWANFFDVSKLDYSSYTAQRTLERVTSSAGNAGFKVTFLDNNNSGHVILDDNIFSSGSLTSLTEPGTYTVLYNIFDTNIVLEDDTDFIALSFYFFSDNATPWGNADYSGSQIIVSNVTHKSMLFLDCFVSLSNGQRREMKAGEYVCFSEVRICFGQANWADYTPYFYSLESLPDIDDGNGDSGNSGNSGSGNGGSTPDVPDVPDVPIVNGSYQEGYLAGLAQAQYGVFHNADFYLSITDANGFNGPYQIYPDFIAGGVDFTTIYQNWRQNYPTLKQCYIYVSFPNPVPVSSLSLAATCHSSVFSISDTWSMFYNDVMLDLKMKWSLDGKVNTTTGFATYQNSFDVTDYYCNFLTFSPVSSMSSYNGFALYMSNDNYSAGYRDGHNSVSDDIYNDGYNAGHRIGYDNGYNSGYNKGSRDGNSFLGLFTAVIDAPVNVFSNLLNFDILGFNMKTVCLSLLSIALVVAILRLFSKGDSSA